MVHTSYAQWACLPSTYRKKVNPGSKAAQQGVREGDLISSINGRNTRDLTNSEAHTLLRNAGDQLKLGLNQESAGSPKRRIYKSSLQENTSIETIQKITKTTKTSATRILPSEETKNGADDTRDERDFVSQNGNLNTRNENTKSADETTKKTSVDPSNRVINLKNSKETSRMPQSSRSRRNRRNRNKSSNHSKNQPEITKASNAPETLEKLSQKPEDVEEPEKITKDVDIIEAKVNGQAVKVTTEVVETALGHEIGSISKQRGAVKRRYKLERHALESQPKICEITTISDLSMEAHIGHVRGVGIIETSSINDGDDSRTIVTEPVEPLVPLSSDVTSRVKSLGERDFALALLPDRSNANNNGPEIHEVTDSDVETTESSRAAVISEVESDVETSKKNYMISEETEESDSTDRREETSVKINENLPEDTINTLAIIIEPELDVEFQERGNLSQTIFEETEESDSTDKETALPRGIINEPVNNNLKGSLTAVETAEVEQLISRQENNMFSEPQSDCESSNKLHSKEIADERIIERIQKSDLDDKFLTSPMNNKLDIEEEAETIPFGLPRIPKTSETRRIDGDLTWSLHNPPGFLNEPSTSLLSETEVEDKIKRQKQMHNATMSKDATKCTADSNENTMEVKSKESSSASSVIVIGEDIQQPREIYEPLSQQFEDKVRFFIDKCDLMSQQQNDNGNLLNDKCHVKKHKTSNTVIQRHSKRVETQENYSLDASMGDRYLDIIHEEAEKPVSHEKHIRDFINEEIGKFRREKRKIDVNEGIMETRNNEFDSCHVTMKSTERNENILERRMEGKERFSVDCDDRTYVTENTNVAMNQVNEDESDAMERPKRAPAPPKRSSSFQSNESEKISRPITTLSTEAHYELPKIPNEVIKAINRNYEYLDLCPPVRPPLPSNFNEDKIISRNDEHHRNEGVSPIRITPNLRNSIEDSGKFGNDDSVSTSTEIERDHIDNIASEVPVKNTWALKESTPICATTMLNNVEVKCSRPQASKITETKEKVILETLKRECIETTEVTSSNVVEIKEYNCDSGKSVDVSPRASENEKLRVHEERVSKIGTASEKKFEKIQETFENRTSDCNERTGWSDVNAANQTACDDQGQDSSSSTASPATVKFISEEDQSLEANDLEPTHLSDLCIKTILSMPYGSQLIKEITHPKFNIFKNLEPIHKTVRTFDNLKPDESTTETMRKRPNTWMGVPTADPHLLVCLSPSQQEANVGTSADKLLDLHRKFLNRRSYRDDRKSEINVPKYHVQVDSKNQTADTMKIEKKEVMQSHGRTLPSNRLLEIIKENSIREDLPLDTESNKAVEQNRLKSTQLANWLTQTNNNHVNPSICESSCNFSSERLRYQDSEKTGDSAFSPVQKRNGHIKDNDQTAEVRTKRQGKIFDDTSKISPPSEKFNDTANRINSALILRMPEGIQEHRSSTQINKSQITCKSAIIDRTSEITEPRKWTLSRSIDPRHVNPALINYKPEAPPRCRRTVDVDRACIDTTSIFNKTPPRGHLEARVYKDPEDLKQATACEIVGNLKQLQRGIRDMADGRRRYSLPQEYFDRQLEYIEKLEDQLKEVILAEEEENKAFEEYEGRIKKIGDKSNQNGFSKSSEILSEELAVSNDGNSSRQTWHEETSIEEKNHTEFTSKEGREECKKCVIQVPGYRTESSMKVFENKEETKITSGSKETGPEWKRFFDDISWDSPDAKEKQDNYGVHEKSERPKSIPVLLSSDEVFRRKMYDEYVHKVSEREERKHHKVIKISSHVDLDKSDKYKNNMSTMEKEFIEKAKDRLSRFGIELDEGENQSMREDVVTNSGEVKENLENGDEAKCLIDGKEIKDAKKLPKHLQEFLKLAISELEDGYGYGIEAGGKTNDSDLLHEIDTALRDSRGFLLRQENMFAPTFKASSAKPGVWSPSSEPPPPPRQPSPDRGKNTNRDAGIPPVWTPSSAGPSPVVERKEFRPVSFESPTLSRKSKPQAQNSTEELPPWKHEEEKKEGSQYITQNITTRIVNSHSVPSQGLNTLANAPRLPRAQNPTITLLQKAREGQLPKGAAYLDENEGEKSHEGARISPGEIIYTLKREYESEPEGEEDRQKKMADLGARKVLGIGPITRDGMPVTLRSEVKETNQAKWYKQMYDSLHRAGRDDDYETIRYKPRRGARYGYGTASGYLSEPEPRISVDRSATLDARRRQRNKENDTATSTMPRKSALVKTTAEVYRNQPGRIENYQPGRSSISEKETKEWWDEVMDIFDGPFDPRNPHAAKPYMSHALKESGYESDSTLIFRRRDDVSPLSPLEQRLAYKTVQKGGDVPLHGFRKPAPERPKDDAEIEYFPISRTLTRIRVRRRTAASSTASMSSMTLNRQNRSAPSLTTLVPLSRAKLISTVPQETSSKHHLPRQRTRLPNLRPPSPPRRLSSRYSETLKLYASSYPQPPNPRHEQCFTAESGASNIKFLRERLSNRFLRHEQGRLTETIRRAPPNSCSATSSGSLRAKFSRSSLSKRKSEPCLLKKSETDESVTSLIKKPPNLGKTTEPKPPISRVNIKLTTSAEAAGNLRGKNSPPCRKKEGKLRRSKRETDETLKRGSSTDLSSSPVVVRRVIHGCRQGDAGSVLTGSVIKSSSSLPRTRSQDTGLSKVISKSRNIQKTTVQSPTLRSTSPVSSISLSRSLIQESSRQKSLTSKSTEKFNVDPPSTIVVGPSSRKKIVEKPQTIVKSPTKRPEAIVISEKDRKIDKKKSPKQEKTRGQKTKKLINGKIESDKKKKKIVSKSQGTKKSNSEEVETTILTMERIKKHTEETRTDTFFQNLFLRKIPSPTPSQSSTVRRTSVMERAKMFQDFNNEKYKSEPSLRSLNIYLTTKRPVSNSRFKNWERESLSSRSSSPYGVSWPGRSVFKKIDKFNDLLGMEEFGSSASLRGRSPELNKEGMKKRSLSEPPIKVSCLSESSSKHSVVASRSSSPSPTRSAACRRIRSLKQERTDFSPLKVRAKSASEADDSERRRITFGSNSSLAKSTSSLESPPINREEYQRYLFEILHSRRKSSRYKDLHDFYASLERMGELVKTTSSGDLRRRLKNEEIIDYDRWKEIRAKERAEQELKVLYGKLKTIQREKDFLFSTKDVERTRWHGDCGLRCKERSVENIRESFRRLAKEESELETTRRRDIASKKDVYKPLWRGNSVVNVASNMTKRANTERCEIDKYIQPTLQKSLGGSNKFWSSLSVEQVNVLKNQLNEIYGSENGNKGAASKSPEEDERTFDHIDKSNITEQTRTIETSDYEVIVPPQEEFADGINDSRALHVRCHSMLMSDIKSSSGSTLTSSLRRSGSICNGMSSEKVRTDEPSPLTESEKKRLSLNLGKEILDKVSRRKNSTSPVTPRETRGAIAVAFAKSSNQTSTTNSTSPRTCYSLEASLDEDRSKSKEKSDFLLVLTPNGESLADRRKVENVLDEWSKKPPLLAMTVPENSQIRNTSGSEFDSATESSENSVKTVVQRENEPEDVPRKIEFFESIEKENRSSSKTIKKSKLSSSQSFADLKDLFGETESARYATLPFRSHRSSSRGRMTSPGNEKGRSTSASPDVPCGRFTGISCREHENNRPRSVSPCRVSSSTGSFESLRQRSVSPDPERYWRAYLNLVKHGAVRKIREKFESLEELSGDRVRQIATPKRFQSDPELTRNFLKRVDEKKIIFKPQEVPDVAWLRRKYEPVRGRSKWRNASPPIPRIPLRLEDLQMPHINVISKTAELKDSMSRSSSMNSLAIKAETEELEAKKPVGRLRGKFEKFETVKPSILGEMFTSAPDVHELRDISPYLAGRWVAHRYPNRRDNARSISLPPELETVKGEKVKLRESKSATLPKRAGKSKESSPVRSRRPGSILKQPQSDPFANQPFDPSKHRPRYRYQPPPPLPPAPVVRRPWWPPMPTYTARPTVTFEGSERALEKL